MLSSRWFLLGPVLCVAWACGDNAGDSGSSDGGTGNPTGGSGNPTGGSSTGGTAGSASGASGTAGTGATATGGSAGTSTSGTGGSGPQVTCTITATSSLSPAIATVGIVNFTADLAGMTEAHIDFGLDTNYGMTAPVDLASPMYRTLLLGMKASSMYHYRVVASSPAGQCMGPDATLATGPVPNGLLEVEVTTTDAQAVYGGFLITGMYARAGGGGGGMSAAAYILDADGDLVWWHTTNHDVTGARMTYDGKAMWINSANVPSGTAHVRRVSMDGMTDEDMSSEFTGQNHQLTVLPDETVVFYAYGSNNCDDIKERSPTGTVRTIVNSLTAHGAMNPDMCHVNAIEYSPEDDTIVFSDLDHDNYTKVRRNGEVVWVLGGSTSDFTGMGATWDRQHGVDVLAENRFLIFNNGATGSSAASAALEITLDLSAMTATRSWTYTAMPSIHNEIMGDVQRLENGNTIVAYSTQGVLHEVSPTGELLQEIEWTSTPGAFGYIQKRKTLYGPPPR